MDKISGPKQIDHAPFLRSYLAVQTPDAFPSAIWIPVLNQLFEELSESDKELIARNLDSSAQLSPGERATFVELDRKLRSGSLLQALNEALTRFEEAFFCDDKADGACALCGRPNGVGGPLCAKRISSEAGTAEAVAPVVDADAGAEDARANDPLLDYFKIPAEPGEINGFDYDAIIDSTPVIVWRPPCEIETDFVDDLLREAESAGITRVFLIARTEVGPDKLPINPNVALILLAVPPAFGPSAGNVIETDELVYS